MELELALYALCAAAAFAVGGVHPEVQLGLGGAALVLLWACAAKLLREKRLRVPPLTWPMLAALLWTAFQLVPLPLGVLFKLSPVAATLRGDLGATRAPITLDVAGTSLELVKQVGYVCVFLLATALLRTRSGTRRAAGALAVLGAAMTLSIVVHRGLGLHSFFGLYTPKGHPGSGYWAPFVNGNHAASVLALCALAAFGLLASTERAVAKAAWAVAACGSTAALLATMSRGAALALALGGFVLGAFVAGQRFGRTRGLLLATLLLVIVGAGVFTVADGLRERLFARGGTETVVSNQKTRAWTVALALARDFKLTGVGRGAFEAPAAAKRVDTEGIRLNYAEDFVLQVIAEWGWPVGLGLLLATAMLIVGVVRRLPPEAEVAGLCAGILATTLHGLVDCGFEIPGVLLPLCLALGAVVARSEGHGRSKRKPRPRLGAIALVGGAVAGVLVLVVGARARGHALDAEVGSLAITLRAPPSEDEIADVLRRHPASAELEMLAGRAALQRGDRTVLHHLGRAMSLQPSLPEPHQLAAVELLRLRRPAQAAVEYRLAAERGAIIGSQELVRYIGRHAIDAVPRTPLALDDVAAALAATGDWEAADAAFRRAAELGGGEHTRKARLAAFERAPVERRRDAAEQVAREAKDGDELAGAIRTLCALGALDRADQLADQGRKRFPESAAVVVEGARARAARGDLDGGRAMLAHSARFDAVGRLRVAEAAVELAQKAGDVEAATAAQARLRLLRAKVDLEQPSGHSP